MAIQDERSECEMHTGIRSWFVRLTRIHAKFWFGQSGNTRRTGFRVANKKTVVATLALF